VQSALYADLWHRPGGATGDECFEIVRQKTLARRAKESAAAQKKVERAETRKSRISDKNSRKRRRKK